MGSKVGAEHVRVCGSVGNISPKENEEDDGRRTGQPTVGGGGFCQFG